MQINERAVQLDELARSGSAAWIGYRSKKGSCGKQKRSSPMSPTRSPMIPAVKAKLLDGKRGLIVGIANDQSIAWGCAKAFRAFGAELAVTYLNEKAKKYVEPLARELEAPIVLPLDAREPGQMEAVF